MNVTQEDVVNVIKKVGISKDISTFSSEDSLRNAGIDSLDMMNIFLSIEEQFNIKIPDEDINALDSIEGIVNYLNLLQEN